MTAPQATPSTPQLSASTDTRSPIDEAPLNPAQLPSNPESVSPSPNPTRGSSPQIPAEAPVRTRTRTLPSPVARRATVIGAGSFGTALAVLLSRAGLRTTLQTRSPEQAKLLSDEHENKLYLPGVELPGQLRVEPVSAGVARAD